MDETATVGLRERKRAETRDLLERSALSIAQSAGLEHATVDAISAASNVSSRTFFNYFEGKEDAVLGIRDVELTDEALADHAARYQDADLVESVIGLLSTVLSPKFSDSAMQKSRRELVQKYPHLLARQVAQLSRMGEQLTAAISTLLSRDPNFAGTAAGADTASPQVVLALCGGAYRVAASEWTASGESHNREELESRAVSLVREVTEKLQ